MLYLVVIGSDRVLAKYDQYNKSLSIIAMTSANISIDVLNKDKQGVGPTVFTS